MIELVISFIFLVAMEVALGIDNVIFVSILAGKLPKEEQGKARRWWMVAGIALRVALLAGITVLIKYLQQPLFTLDIEALGYHNDFTGKHFIMLAGGLFLLIKAVLEIHEKLEIDHEGKKKVKSEKKKFSQVISQIILIDLVFSIDSIVTAIGMVSPEKEGGIFAMSAAVVIAMVGMFVFARRIGEFVFKHPTFKMLALSFLLLIGVLLVAEGVGQHISKSYVYFAMLFSIGVELLNMRIRRKSESVRLNLPDPENA